MSGLVPLFARDSNALVATLCHCAESSAWPVIYASRASGLEQDKRTWRPISRSGMALFAITRAKPC